MDFIFNCADRIKPADVYVMASYNVPLNCYFSVHGISESGRIDKIVFKGTEANGSWQC